MPLGRVRFQDGRLGLGVEGEDPEGVVGLDVRAGGADGEDPPLIVFAGDAYALAGGEEQLDRSAGVFPGEEEVVAGRDEGGVLDGLEDAFACDSSGGVGME